MLPAVIRMLLRPWRWHACKQNHMPCALPKHMRRLLHSSTRSSQPHTQDEVHLRAPVLISGAGPSGLTLAALLSRYGIRSLVLEQSTGLTTHPQAHYINNRTMEVFRTINSAGLSGEQGPSSSSCSNANCSTSKGLAAEVAARTPALDEWRKFVYCHSMVGEALGEVDHFKGQSTPHSPGISPEPVAHLPQHRLLPLLLCHVQAPGSHARVLFGHSVQSIQLSSSGGGVEAQVLCPGNKRAKASAEFLVAGDGAHSMVRRALGIALRGQAGIQHLINIHITSKSLGQKLLNSTTTTSSSSSSSSSSKQQEEKAVGPRAAMLYFVFNRSVVAVIVAHDLQRGEFVAQVPYFPPLQSVRDFPLPVCTDIICAAAGIPSDQLSDLRVLQARPWTMSSLVADRYMHPGHSSRHGGGGGSPNTSRQNSAAGSQTPLPRIFLVGDAAHCFPPAGGFGMNTGVQDVHNLAWKLALVLQSVQHSESASTHQDHRSSNSLCLSPAHLLSSYEVERRPVAQANAALSESNWREAVRVPSMLGLDPRAADLLNRIASNVPGPSSFKHRLLEAGLSLGKVATTAWTPAPLRAWQKLQLERIFGSGETLRLQFPREDLGFVYAQGAVAGTAHHTSRVSTRQQHPGGPSGAIHHQHQHRQQQQQQIHQQQQQLQQQQQASSGRAFKNVRPEHAVIGSAEVPHPAGRGAPYVPSSAPGCRMPHLWLAPYTTQPSSSATPADPSASHHPSHNIPEAWVSTLDVAAGQAGAPPSFVLFVYGGGDDLCGVCHSGGVRGGEHGGSKHTEQLNKAETDGAVSGLSSEGRVGDRMCPSPWVHAAQRANEQGRAGGLVHDLVRVVRVLPGSARSHLVAQDVQSQEGVHSGSSSCSSSSSSRAGCTEGVFEQLWLDADDSWPRVMQLPQGSVVLVRPDGQIAWRCVPYGHSVSGPAVSGGDSSSSSSSSSGGGGGGGGGVRGRASVPAQGSVPVSEGSVDLADTQVKEIEAAAALLQGALHRILVGE